MNISRRNFIQALSGTASLALTAKDRPLNIVLVLADDLGWSDVGVYGSKFHETPHLDRFAKSAVRFTHAYSASPVCSPTRASILTGKNPARVGMTIWHEGAVDPPKNRPLLPASSKPNLPTTEQTLPKLLRERGYSTGHIGKWHLGTADFSPEVHGFDFNIGGTHWGAPNRYHHPFRGMTRTEYRYVPGLPWSKPGDYLPDKLTDEALTAITNWKDKPFFLNLWHHSPHTPIEGKPKDVEYFRAKLNQGDQSQHQQPAYAAMIRNLDENFGRLMDHLEQAGIADQTLVIFASDNGGYIADFEGKPITSNAPLRSGKGSLYEGGIRIPLLIRWPGHTKAGICHTPVTTMDLFQTILDATGGIAPSGMDGISLRPALKNTAAGLNRSDLFFHYPHYYHAPPTTPVSAVLSNKWKLIQFFEEDRFELFNLEEDPGEKKDLARSDPQKTTEMIAKLKEWQKSVGAQLPAPNPAYRNQ